MRQPSRRRLVPALAALAMGLMGTAPPASAQRQSTDPVDCEGPAPGASPGTPEWSSRDAQNVFCAGQRHLDQTMHPLSAAPFSAEMFGTAPMSLTDEYRPPSRHDGVRFRFDATTITNRAGEGLAAEVYRPCARGRCRGMPSPLQTFEPRYPAVIVLHGGGSRKELHWWSSQSLAEAGYMVVAFNGAASDRQNAEDVLDWLLATPGRPTRKGQHNPFSKELDRKRIGIAGHSRGGQTASVLGQDDPRISTIVSWDRGTGLRLPKDLDTPTLFFIADYACQENPVCEPEPYPEPPPDPRGPEGRGREYEIVRAAGVDSMKIAMRAATHLDWVPSEPSGNRYVEIVSVYYTLAWFDRYLKGSGDSKLAKNAFKRLTASVFDGSADRHNISQGFYDPVRAAAAGDPYAGNVPYGIKGMPAANRMSFYFPSKCYLTLPGGEGLLARSEDIRRTGCPGGGRLVRSGCLARRAPIGPRNVGRVRLGRTRRQLLRRIRPRPVRRTRYSYRWCVKRSSGRVTAVFSRRSRRGGARLVTTTAPAHGMRRVRPGSRRRSLLRRFPRARRLTRTIYRAGPRSRRIFGLRRGRVRFIAVADRRLLRNRRALSRYLRRAGL